MNSKEKVLIHKGMDRVKRKDFPGAIEIFERILATNQEIPEAWNNRGVALYALGRIDEARESYDRCLELDPENLDAMRNKGFLLRNQKKLEEALQVYDSVLQKGGDAFDMESTAAVLTALGRLEEALNCLYLAREEMQLDRFEDEIGTIQAMISERRGPDTDEKSDINKI